MQNISFLEGVILIIPGGVDGLGGWVGWVGGVGAFRVGESRNKTKLQPSSVEVELWLSLDTPFC